MRLITAFGTGVLVGTALIVIIPEGIETIYSASSDLHTHSTRSLDHLGLIAGQSQPEIMLRHDMTSKAEISVAGDWPEDAFTGKYDRHFRINPRTDTSDDGLATAAQGDTPDKETTDASPPVHGEGSGHGPSAWVGLALISGFILMYLIDTLSRHASTPSHPRRVSMSLARFNLHNPTTSTSSQDSSNTSHTDRFGGSISARASSTTIGLVIHALADGIALGASSATTSRLTFVIFIALMLHKAPAAFGLTTVLIKQGLSKRAARAHIIVFSLAAPIGALMTWTLTHLLGSSISMPSTSSSSSPSATSSSSNENRQARTEFATGVLLLFSAGTFLYVAMHTMQEANNTTGHGHRHHLLGSGASIGNGGELGSGMENGHGGEYDSESAYGDASRGTDKDGSPTSHVLATVVGMLIPLLTQFGHAH